MEQCVPLGHIVDVGRRAEDRVHQTGLSVHPDMGFHAEVPLVALLDLVHLGVALTGLVLGRIGHRNQSSVYHGARLKQKAMGGQLGVDDLQNLGAQFVLFEPMKESQDTDTVRDSLGAAESCEVPVLRRPNTAMHCGSRMQSVAMSACRCQHWRFCAGVAKAATDCDEVQ